MYASTPCFALQNGRCVTQPYYPHLPITADCVATPWNMYFWNNVSACFSLVTMETRRQCLYGHKHLKTPKTLEFKAAVAKFQGA